MSETVKGIVLKSKDVGEQDKLVCILTDKLGRISVKFKSVKKANAKLRFATEPFCFGEFELEKTGGGYLCTGAEMYELFYSLRGDIERFYLGSCVLEIAYNACEENAPSGDELVFCVKALSRITSVKANIEYLAARIILDAIGVFGFGISDYTCKETGEEIEGDGYFVFDSCAFYCEKHKKEYCTLVDRRTFELIKNCGRLSDEEIEKLPFERETAIKAMRFLYKLIYYKLFFKCESLSSFAKMM